MSLKLNPLQGEYLNKPIVVSSTKSYDEAWSSMIDLFAENGLAINVLDKDSGLLTSLRTDLLPYFTVEKRDGTLMDTEAYVVVESIRYSNVNTIFRPSSLTGTWNVRIKKDGAGSSINVNLVNIQASLSSSPTNYINGFSRSLDARSTGVFESFIANKIK
jgi:hypothetical protein